MNMDGSDISLSIFFAATAIVLVCLFNSRACTNITKSEAVQCAEACRPLGMSERDRDGNCRCQRMSDAGAFDAP
jgi:hypothetical protein